MAPRITLNQSKVKIFITAHYAAGSYGTASVLPKGLGIKNIVFY